MPAPKDITGMKFGKLTAVEWTGRSTPNSGREWLCICDCGATFLCGISKLCVGNTKSCGCLKTDTLVLRNTTHGLSNTPEYMSWKDMKKRCNNPKNKRYENYGAIGIKVCSQWENDFEQFLSDVGNIPTDGNRYTLGRIDNRLGYFPENCVWQLDVEQVREHSKQKNNTSGVTGIHVKTTTINGKEYQSWCACVSLFKKKMTKEFSWNKYGEKEAFILAKNWRTEKLRELEGVGVFYHESHGEHKTGVSMNDS